LVLSRSRLGSRVAKHECSDSIIATEFVLNGVAAVVGPLLVILLAPHSEFRGKMQVRVVFAAIEVLIFAPLLLSGWQELSFR
jgi:hypothetical protein